MGRGIPGTRPRTGVADESEGRRARHGDGERRRGAGASEGYRSGEARRRRERAVHGAWARKRLPPS